MRIVNSKFVTSATQFRHLPKSTLPEIAFMGRSNVGKSSLINTLLNRKNLAQISKNPGKTRAINLFEVEYINIKDKKDKLIFADLPGYGYAKVSDKIRLDWKRLVENYLQKQEKLCGVVIIVDIRHSADEKDIQAVKWVSSFQKPLLLVATKSDKLSKSKINLQVNLLKQEFSLLSDEQIIGFSSKSCFGKEKIMAWINEKKTQHCIPNPQFNWGGL
ncbi:MAG: ribosome biogenesis GTP-binding protein YihA/YsxC [Candidatus Cloacimonadota bacterium]|nr:ribosome biogenesis GTP-binding protein YihA/YsxC [Candidatus Cloacimonadota bacterium]